MSPSYEKKFYCPGCARAALYSHRLEQASLLLDRERFRRQVDGTISSNTKGAKASNGSSILEFESAHSKSHDVRSLGDLQEAREKVNSIIQKSQSLAASIEAYKQELATRKESVQRRRTAKASATVELQLARTDFLDPLRKQIRKTRHRYDRLSAEIIVGRAYLCENASLLAGLSKDKENLKSTFSVLLAGLPIPDLRELNNIPPAQITASFTQISRLLHLTCIYLSIRLPAEIVIPRHDRPLPAILPPSSSYLESTRLSTRSNLGGILNPALPRNDATMMELPPSLSNTKPRPRPLSVDRRLPQLAKEDPQQYSLFIEGAALLAWNIAWLCRTQGVKVAETAWEDIGCMGRNLWLLFIDATAKEQGPKTVAQGTKSKQDEGTKRLPESIGDESSTADPPWFGHRSHGTAYSFLPLASSTPPSGVDVAASISTSNPKTGWIFAHPLRLGDLLRQHLLADMQGAEWEVLDDEEVMDGIAQAQANGDQVEGNDDKRGVLDVDGLGRVMTGRRDPRSTKDQPPAGNDNISIRLTPVGSGGEAPSKEKKVNGWTKVKSRGID